MSIVKAVRDITDRLTKEAETETDKPRSARELVLEMETRELQKVISGLESQMKASAQTLEFERAAMLRDQVYELRALLMERSNLPAWKKQELLAPRAD